jgi:hypothetical protein
MVFDLVNSIEFGDVGVSSSTFTDFFYLHKRVYMFEVCVPGTRPRNVQMVILDLKQTQQAATLSHSTWHYGMASG